MECVCQSVLQLLGRPQQQYITGTLHQGDDTEEDEGGDEEGTDRVGDVPAERLDQKCGDDHPHAAQGVSQDVEEHTYNQGHHRMRRVDMITPTLPRVSASTWRNTPVTRGIIE